MKRWTLNEKGSREHDEVEKIINSCGPNNGIRFLAEGAVVEVVAADPTGAMIETKLGRSGYLAGGKS